MTVPIEITSILSVRQRPALEELLFFNGNQHRVRGGIEQCIAAYGEPTIESEGGHLRVRVGALAGVHTLYAVDQLRRPLGVVVYVRADRERFQVLHLGLHPRLGPGPEHNTRVLLMFMHRIRGGDRRARRPASIELVYAASRSARPRRAG